MHYEQRKMRIEPASVEPRKSLKGKKGAGEHRPAAPPPPRGFREEHETTVTLASEGAYFERGWLATRVHQETGLLAKAARRSRPVGRSGGGGHFPPGPAAVSKR